jgi:hypothetical protein
MQMVVAEYKLLHVPTAALAGFATGRRAPTRGNDPAGTNIGRFDPSRRSPRNLGIAGFLAA